MPTPENAVRALGNCSTAQLVEMYETLEPRPDETSQVVCEWITAALGRRNPDALIRWRNRNAASPRRFFVE